MGPFLIVKYNEVTNSLTVTWHFPWAYRRRSGDGFYLKHVAKHIEEQ